MWTRREREEADSGADASVRTTGVRSGSAAADPLSGAAAVRPRWGGRDTSPHGRHAALERCRFAFMVGRG
ncbi:hypothetical protein ABTE71_20575, partial [Acinetobacter baumannii]